MADKPAHWLRFDETTVANPLTDSGSSAAQFTILSGTAIVDADQGEYHATQVVSVAAFSTRRPVATCVRHKISA